MYVWYTSKRMQQFVNIFVPLMTFVLLFDKKRWCFVLHFDSLPLILREVPEYSIVALFST